LIATPASARNFKATIDPGTPVVGQTTTMTGCGYDANTFLKVSIVWYTDETHATGTDNYLITDDSGCFSLDYAPPGHGEIELWAFQHNNGGNGLQLKCKIEFDI
jgi:hypothetical protein